jgi:FixJ family two-component response regulator
MQENRREVFIVEHDDRRYQNSVETVLGGAGLIVHTFKKAATCIEVLLCKEKKCNVVIMCFQKLSFTGLGFIEKVRASRPSIPIIVVTSPVDAALAFKALKSGIYDFIEKPVEAEYLISSVQNALVECPGEHLPVASILSRTEYEVLKHILNGESTPQIALKRQRSIRTVEDQRAAIMKKMKVDNLIDLVKRVAYVAISLD